MTTKTTFIVDSRALLRRVKTMRENVGLGRQWHNIVWLLQDGGCLKMEHFSARDECLTALVHGTIADGHVFVGVDMARLSAILKFCPERIRLDLVDNALLISHAEQGQQGHAVIAGANVSWRGVRPSAGDLQPVPNLGRIVVAMAEVLSSASHDANTDQIHCVHFSARGDDFIVEAMNGHMYQRKTISGAGRAGAPLDGLLLPLTHAKRFVSLWGRGFFGRNVTVSMVGADNNNLARLFVQGDAGSWIVPFRAFKKPYPDTDVFLRRRSDAVCSIKVRAGAFLAALRSLEHLMGDYCSFADVQVSDEAVFLSAQKNSLRDDFGGWQSVPMLHFSGEFPNLLDLSAGKLANMVARISRPCDVLCLVMVGPESPVFVHTEREPDLTSVIMPGRILEGYAPAFSVAEMSTRAESRHE